MHACRVELCLSSVLCLLIGMGGLLGKNCWSAISGELWASTATTEEKNNIKVTKLRIKIPYILKTSITNLVLFL